MGERKHQPITTAATPRSTGEDGARAARVSQPNGNHAAQERLARQGQRLSPDGKQAITSANAARFATSNGVKLADRAAAAATGTDRLLDGTDGAKALGHAGRAVSGGLSVAGHFMGDRMVTGDLWGHGLASGVKGLADTAVSAAATGGPLSSVPGIVDAFVPRDSAWKPVTGTAAAANVFTHVKQGLGAAVDAATVGGEALAHGEAGAMRAAQVLEDNAVDGNYGPAPQSLTAFLALITGDTQLGDRFVDAGAERGDRGVFVQAGNRLGDGAWEAREGYRAGQAERAALFGDHTGAEHYDRSQQGIRNGAAALLEGQSAKEQQESRQLNAMLKDRWAR